MDNGEKTTCEKCGCDHSSDRAPWVIAATIWNGEPRYSVLTTDRAAFDFFKSDRGYEVMTDWDGRIGALLVRETRKRNTISGAATSAGLRSSISALARVASSLISWPRVIG